MNLFGFAIRMLRRDARAGELRLLVAALVVAVAALTAVGFFTDRVRQSLEREATQLLGADLVLVSDRPWPDQIKQEAIERGLRYADTRTFPSMVGTVGMAERRVQLSEIKSVSEGYPLRGELRVSHPVGAEVLASNSRAQQQDRIAEGIPASGSAWIDERLALVLGVQPGDSLQLGRIVLRITALLTYEPDRGVNFFSVAPRVLINAADLEKSGLIGTGSRVVYRLLVAGDIAQVKTFRERLSARLSPGQRIEGIDNARPEVRTALERAQRFLGLASVLSIVLAAVSVALAARRYMQRHLDACAVLRCLGMTQGALLRVHCIQFVVLASGGAMLGCLLGYAAHFILHAWLSDLLPVALPAPGWLPAMQGMIVGFILLLGFALPPILRLNGVSTLRVLRREFGQTGASYWYLVGSLFFGVTLLGGLMLWLAGDVRLGVYTVSGFIVASLIFLVLARIAVRAAASVRGRSVGVGWQFGLASLERHAVASVVQIVALALAFMALLLLTATRNDLLSAWQNAVPENAPNRFVINIQPEQLSAVRQVFSDAGLDAQFSPMVRGRLVRLNERNVLAADYSDERAKRLVDREFNLSYQLELPPGNRTTVGRWFDTGDQGRGVASVEEGLAKTLGIRVGDRLRFDIAGETVEVQVMGLRKLNWDSMRVNFFVLMPPGLIDSFSASWITSLYLPPHKQAVTPLLVGQFPNLTVVDVGAIVQQLRRIFDQVARAVQFVFVFTLLAGVIVLYTALASATEERRYELAVLRAMGASISQLRRALLIELFAIGASAGAIASSAALLVAQVLSQRLFQFDTPVDWSLIPLSLLFGGVVVPLVGWWAVRPLLNIPPVEALRAAA